MLRSFATVIEAPTGSPNSSPFLRSFVKGSMLAVAFIATVAATYLALASGFVWLVLLFGGAGLVYAGRLVLLLGASPKEAAAVPVTAAKPQVPPLPAAAKKPTAADLRAQVLDELIASKTDGELMAKAEELEGPGGHIASRYIELRVEQLAGAANARP